MSKERHYALGMAIFDLEDPTQLLFRQREPILEASLDWEIHGYVPNVVFSCGQVIIDDQLVVYYGGADTAIGAAAIKLSKLESV